ATLPASAAPKSEPIVQEEADNVGINPRVDPGQTQGSVPTENTVASPLSQETAEETIENPVVEIKQENNVGVNPGVDLGQTQGSVPTQNIKESIHEPVVTKPATPTIHPHQKTFDALVKKLYDRDYDLGTCFERNIAFENFEDNKLTWGSMAEGADKKTLITHWGLINMFVKDIFGFETKIINMPKKKVADSLRQAPRAETNTTSVAEPTEAPHQDADSASMLEDIEMKSSCIAPEAGETEAAKEKDPSTLLEEPMIKEAIALFDPKKVRIKRNS
ncbi:MAG: hypothetical protein KJO45_04270, partial [Sulfurovum sp.]|nr:hypothetical protein [Sulfurovum sp.]